MRIGVMLAYWPWYTPDQQLELALLADELGLDSVWVAEAWGQDVVSTLGVLAGRTSHVGLGSAIMQIPARQPAAAAMAAASIDVWSNGRMRLGLGLSGPQVSEGWYGVPFTHGLRRTREYVEIVRAALSGKRLSYEGQEWTLPLANGEGTGLGKPLKLLARPIQNPIPIYLATSTPKAIEQTGAIADGWLPFMFAADGAGEDLEHLRAGAERSGRTLADIDVAPTVNVAVDEDLDVARDALRPFLAFYMGSMGAKDKNFYVELAERRGHGDAARRVQELGLAGDRAAAAAAIPSELIDDLALTATPATLDKRLAAYEAAGVTTLLAAVHGPDRAGTLRMLAAAAHG
jgi:F420-dependent oxidoreductase-like protein